MSSNQLDLKDIHLPDPISWFPPAIGWWLLLLLLPVLIAFVYWLVKRLTRQTALKSAKQQLVMVKSSSLNNQQKLMALSALLRRVAISTAPRAQTASLTGIAWLAFLDSSLKDSPFSNGVGRCLVDAPYRKTALSEQELFQLISLCEDWLTQQKS